MFVLRRSNHTRGCGWYCTVRTCSLSTNISRTRDGPKHGWYIGTGSWSKVRTNSDGNHFQINQPVSANSPLVVRLWRAGCVMCRGVVCLGSRANPDRALFTGYVDCHHSPKGLCLLAYTWGGKRRVRPFNRGLRVCFLTDLTPFRRWCWCGSRVVGWKYDVCPPSLPFHHTSFHQ